MGWLKSAAIGAAWGLCVGIAAMTGWYYLFPPGAPASYFVAISGPTIADRYATLHIDGGLIVKIVAFSSLLGAAVVAGLAALRSHTRPPHRRLFEAASIVGLCTLAGAAITTVVYQVEHRFDSSPTPGHWPSTQFDYLVPLMPVIGFLLGLSCAALWLKKRPGPEQ